MNSLPGIIQNLLGQSAGCCSEINWNVDLKNERKVAHASFGQRKKVK
jgi:hypothetical protein